MKMLITKCLLILLILRKTGEQIENFWKILRFTLESMLLSKFTFNISKMKLK